MQKNFKTIQNLYSYLSDPSSCSINFSDGTLQLHSKVILENGVKISLPTGELKLSEYERGRNEELYNLIPLVFS